MKKEIEILWTLETDIDKCIDILSIYASGSEIKVVDYYLVDQKRDDLKPIDFRLNHCLRIRKKYENGQEKCTVTFKKDFFENDTWLYSDETESYVESFDNIKSIFEKLGFEKLIEINNTKHKFIIGNYEIVVEAVKDLGNFIEIEIINTDNIGDVKEEKDNIRNFLKDLGIEIGTEMNSGKPELMLRKQYRDVV